MHQAVEKVIKKGFSHPLSSGFIPQTSLLPQINAPLAGLLQQKYAVSTSSSQNGAINTSLSWYDGPRPSTWVKPLSQTHSAIPNIEDKKKAQYADLLDNELGKLKWEDRLEFLRKEDDRVKKRLEYLELHAHRDDFFRPDSFDTLGSMKKLAVWRREILEVYLYDQQCYVHNLRHIRSWGWFGSLKAWFKGQ